MVTGEIKNKIDGIWETFWTGGLTNPLSVMEQITYLMFIKLLDDNQTKREASASAMGLTAQSIKGRVFGDGECVIDKESNLKIDYKDLRWHNFKNEEPSKMFLRMRDYIFPFIKNLSGGKDTAFARYMKDSIFMIPTPRILAKVIDGLDALDMTDKDSMGDVYEYLLFKIASSGENGQFRTPRHIIDMMVRLMKPTLADAICDPAMGSAGFIASSANYITEQDKEKSDLLKRENQEKFQSKMFTGFDTDPTMLRIGAMNMMLHGVENPHIEYRDSLSDENEERNKYSLILANPPFTGSLDYEAVSKDLLALCKTKKTELLFLALFTKMLEVGGRCASIVPDGVLFGSSTAHKSIREELVEKQCLTAVILMPSGVFKPYAGVSTAILIFTKTNAGGTNKVWFYDMRADGFSLDDKRTPIKQDDTPDIIARFNNLDGEAGRERTEQSFFVDKAEIVANCYDLSINKYKKTEHVAEVFASPKDILTEIKKLHAEIDTNLDNISWESTRGQANRVKLKDLVEVITKGTTPTTLGFPFVKEGINFIKIENITTDNKIILDKVDCISNECNDKLKRSQLQIGDILFSIAGAIGRCAIVGESALPANTNQALAIIRLKKDTQVDKNYLIKVLQSDKIIGQYTKMKQGVAQLNLSLANIGDFEIDLPSPSVQQCIAAELDAVCEVKSSLKMEIEKTETLYKALMQKYFDPKMMMEVL